MKMQQLTATNKTAPRWAGDFGDRRTMLPGGARLNAAAFPAGADGKKYVAAGTVVGKSPADTNFSPATVNHEQVFILLYDVRDAADKADAELYTAGVVYVNFLPAQGQAAVTALGARLRQQYILTEGR